MENSSSYILIESIAFEDNELDIVVNKEVYGKELLDSQYRQMFLLKKGEATLRTEYLTAVVNSIPKQLLEYFVDRFSQSINLGYNDVWIIFLENTRKGILSA